MKAESKKKKLRAGDTTKKKDKLVKERSKSNGKWDQEVRVGLQ